MGLNAAGGMESRIDLAHTIFAIPYQADTRPAQLPLNCGIGIDSYASVIDRLGTRALDLAGHAALGARATVLFVGV